MKENNFESNRIRADANRLGKSADTNPVPVTDHSPEKDMNNGNNNNDLLISQNHDQEEKSLGAKVHLQHPGTTAASGTNDADTIEGKTTTADAATVE